MKNKKEKLVVILLVVGLIVMTGVISFAAFRFTQTGSVLNQITTGSITMSYTESSNVISMTGALPTTDATGKVRLNEGEYFDFTVGSSITGTANINFEIAAQELDGNTIDGSYIKYYLTTVDSTGNETEVMSPKVYTEESESNAFTGRPANMMSLYEGSMSASTTTKYRLRLYVDESYNPQGDGGNLVYKTRVNVYGLTGDEIQEGLAAGLYDAEGNMTYSWQALIDMGVLINDNNCIYVYTSCGCNGEFNGDESIFDSYSDISEFWYDGVLVIDESITSIGALNCGEQTSYLKSVILPNTITEIKDSAFVNCVELTTIEIPGSVTSIGGNAFAGTPWLTNKRAENPLVIVNNILIDGQTASGDVVIPEGVVKVNDGAFYGNKNLTSIEIPDSVTSIGMSAFRGCTGLASIEIPDSVTSIKSAAFYGCTGLTSIYIPSSVTTIAGADENDNEAYTFANCSSTFKIYCGASEAQPGWNYDWNWLDGSGETYSVKYGVTREQYNAIIGA